jgi:hypothetical protein
MTYLDSVVALLWPDPAQISHPGRRSRSSGSQTYVVIPSARKPKLLVPSRPRRVASAAIRNFKTASSPREQTMINALAVAARVGLGDALPDRIRIDYEPGETSNGIDAALSGVLGEQVWVSLYISPARAVRKPLLQVIDAHGRTRAFAKLGIDEFTRTLVHDEATAVRFLAAQDWAVLRVPTVLHAGSWQGNELLVQSAFARGATPDVDSPELHVAMRELAAVCGLASGRLGTSTYWAQLTGRISALKSSEHDPLLHRLVGAIERTGGAVELDFGASHGDWAPWNMTMANGRLLAWDWEKFESGVPVGLDAVHFTVQGEVVLGGVAPAAAFGAALHNAHRLLSPVAVRPPARRLVVFLYALHIVVRYLEDGELSAGAGRMSRLSTWLPALVAAAEAEDARPEAI